MSIKSTDTKKKLIRITTVPISLEKLIFGQMRFMSEHGFEVYMMSSSYQNVFQLEQKENSTYIPVDMTRTISPLKDLFSLFKIILIFNRLKPVIVHTHTPKAGFLGMLAARITGVPIRLHTVAGLPLMESSGFKRKILEWVEWSTYQCAIKVYPNSKKLKEFIIENNFCKKDKLKVIGNGSSNGIDTTYFKLNQSIVGEGNELKKKFNLTGSTFIFIFIGRLVKDKGLEELVQAFVSLNQTYTDIRLFLVGPFESDLDPLSDQCMQLISNNKAILSSGFQKDVRPYLAISNALVFPSYREGFPNVPMQAGCFNLPAIVSDINGCNEIVENEINGLIIPPKNIIALEEAMLRLLQDKILYSKLKENARNKIVERYEQTHFWQLLFHEYREQLERHEYALNIKYNN